MSDPSERTNDEKVPPDQRVRPGPGQEPPDGAPAAPGQRDRKDVEDPFGADEPG